MNDNDVQFAELVKRYQGYLWAIAYANIGPQFRKKLDAADIVQATFLKAHAAFAEVEATDEPTLLSWLRKVLISVLANEFRKLHREKRDVGREHAISMAVDSTAAGMEHWLVADQTSPSMAAAKNERLLKLADALIELSPEQREVVIQKHLQGQTLQQISDQTGRSIPAIAGLLRRGLEKLRDIMPPD